MLRLKKTIQKGVASVLTEEQQRLVEDNKGLVYWFLRKHKKRAFNPERYICTFEDLVQAGLTGMCKAAERWNPHRGATFATYALYWVRQCIEAELASCTVHIKFPYYRYWKMRKKRQDFPVSEEVDLTELLTTEHAESNSMNFINKLPEARETLTEREKHILAARFDEDKQMLKTLGFKYGVTRERIRQIERDALIKLRKFYQAHCRH
jgi:RNA polymerase primary sigma factor